MLRRSGIQSNLMLDIKLITYSFLMCIGISTGHMKKYGRLKGRLSTQQLER